MKKQVIAATLAGLTLVAVPAFAHEDSGKHKGEEMRLEAKMKIGDLTKLIQNANSSQFMVLGEVKSLGTNSFVVEVKASAHVSNVTNGQVTIKTNADTKFQTPVAVGQNVVVLGNISGSDLLATRVNWVHRNDNEKPAPKQSVAMGKVTAKTANSLTITNTLTNTTKTISTDANTVVKIDGETKTLADVNVGDSGWIKFKTMGSTLIAKIIRLFR